MAIDLKLTHASQVLSRPVAAGAIIEQEGALLTAVIEDGVEKVKITATVAGTEKVIGFSRLGDALPDRTSGVEVVTVPTAPAALEVDLRASNLVTARVRVVVVSSGQVLTNDYTYAGSPADDAVKIDLVGGRLKFHADEAGAKVQVTYLRDLTSQQAKQIFGQRHINNLGLHADFGQLEVASGIGELYTDQFDPMQDYASSAALTLGNGGIITKGGAGPALNATVVHVPSESSPFLGIRFRFTP